MEALGPLGIGGGGEGKGGGDEEGGGELNTCGRSPERELSLARLRLCDTCREGKGNADTLK